MRNDKMKFRVSVLIEPVPSMSIPQVACCLATELREKVICDQQRISLVLINGINEIIRGLKAAERELERGQEVKTDRYDPVRAGNRPRNRSKEIDCPI